MTRKDYELIAGVLDNCSPDTRHEQAIRQHRTTVHEMAVSLAADNPRFDRAKFLKACGL
jgi:hypothetical protein